jgi:hypothetical protein
LVVIFYRYDRLGQICFASSFERWCSMEGVGPHKSVFGKWGRLLSTATVKGVLKFVLSDSQFDLHRRRCRQKEKYRRHFLEYTPHKIFISNSSRRLCVQQARTFRLPDKIVTTYICKHIFLSQTLIRVIFLAARAFDLASLPHPTPTSGSSKSSRDH